MDWQNALVVVVVLFALFYLTRRAARQLRAPKGGCCAPERSTQKTLVQLTRTKRPR